MALSKQKAVEATGLVRVTNLGEDAVKLGQFKCDCIDSQDAQ